jgi:serine/threonine protein kinase
MIGTPGYYSPEHITNTSIVPGSDIYCVGLLIYEMIVGDKAVVATKDRNEIVRAMHDIDFERLPITDRKMKKMIQKILKSALNFNPQKRTRSCEQIIMQVSEVLLKYQIRYARYAIRQFLNDIGLSNRESREKGQQNIYNGFFRG